jgi:hypothetical protein
MDKTSLGGRAAAPWQFWAVSAISLLWNAFGGYDYIMSRQRNVEYLGQMGDAGEVLAWMDSFPVWAQVLWPVGVWGSVLGSVLLLMRSRHAAVAFLISMIGAIGSFAAQMTVKLPPSMDNMFGKLFPVFILAVIVFLWWYAKRSLARGILR